MHTERAQGPTPVLFLLTLGAAALLGRHRLGALEPPDAIALASGAAAGLATGSAAAGALIAHGHAHVQGRLQLTVAAAIVALLAVWGLLPLLPGVAGWALLGLLVTAHCAAAALQMPAPRRALALERH
jgi:hypothetical protein